MPPRPRTPSHFWRRKRTPERLLQPLPALSKKETPTLSLKFWKWPRMPLSQYIAEGPEVPLKARYGKYASSLNPFARHMLARVGHEGRHLSVRHVAPIDDFMAGLTVFTNDAWLNEVLTTRVRELGLEATYHVKLNKSISDTKLRQLLLPSAPQVTADSPDGLANIGLSVRMPPRIFEVRSASRVLRRAWPTATPTPTLTSTLNHNPNIFEVRSASRVLRESVVATRATAPYLAERRRARGAAEEEEGEVLENELIVTVPADLTATELHP